MLKPFGHSSLKVLGLLLISGALFAQENDSKTRKYISRNQDFVERRASGNLEKGFAKSYFEGYEEAMKLRFASSLKKSNKWTPAGPAGKTRLAGTGRINSITFHPKDTGTLFICVAQGGVWKSTNSGQSWTSVSGDLPLIRTSSLAIDPVNPETMYVAVGDFAYLGHNMRANENKRNTHYGLGIYKTTNGGVNWKATGLSFKQTDFEGSLLSNVMVSPTNPKVVVASGESGCYRSEDGGDNWTKTGNGIFWDMKPAPDKPNVLYASTGFVEVYALGKAAIYRSIDFGKTWNEATVPFKGINQVQRLELSVSASNPAKVYALAADVNTRDGGGSGFEGLYMSADSGKTFTTVIQANTYPYNICHWSFGDEPGGQARYDLAFAVDRKNENAMYTGGINIWASSNGGKDFLPTSKWQLNYQQKSVHGDIHEIKQHPITNRFFVCHDGGLSSTMAIKSVTVSDIENDSTNTVWDHHIDNLSTLSFYRLALNPEDGDEIIAGAQDNSTALKSINGWSNLTGGDGMEAAFAPFDYVYTSSQYGYINRLYKIDDGLYGWDDNVRVPYGEVAEWTTPMVLSGESLYIGYGNLYEFNFSLSAPLTNFDDAKNRDYPLSSSALYVHPDDDNYMYIAKRGYASENIDGEIWTSVDRGKNWTDVSAGLPLEHFPTYMDADDDDPKTAWVTFASFTENEKIYETIDGGKTWTNISYNLPNLPANCVVHQNDQNDNLYVGMDLGIYILDRANKTWEPYMEGLPNVIVSELEVHLNDFKLKAATFGRGIWEVDLEGTPDPIGVDETLDMDLELSAFPNPTRDVLSLSIPKAAEAQLQLSIRDVTGKLVLEENWNMGTKEKQLNVDSWLSGTYFVVLTNGRQRVVSEFVKLD